MRRAAAILLVLLSALAAAGVEDEKAPSAGPPEGKAPLAKGAGDPLVTVAVIAGVVQDTGARGTLNLKVTLRYLEPSKEGQERYGKRYQELFDRQQAILSNRNPTEQQQQLAQLLKDAEGLLDDQEDLFHVKEVQKDVELAVADDVKVRSAVPVQAFDEKGNIKRYTRQQLREMRGTDRLPGYAAEWSDVQPGQTVLVKVAMPRKALVRKADPKAAPAASRKDPPPPADENRPRVYLILIADPMR